MKKGLFVSSILLLSTAASLYGKKLSEKIFEKPVNKTVRFTVYNGTDYSAPLYKKSKATIVLRIYHLSKDKQEVVWQEVIDKVNLRNYAKDHKISYREVCVHNVLDYKETLGAYYEVSYASKGSKISYTQGVPLSRGAKIDSVRIAI